MTPLIKIELAWSSDWNPVKLASANEILKPEKPVQTEGSHSWLKHDCREHLVSLQQMKQMVAAKVEFAVTEITDYARIEEFEPRPTAPAPVNEKCNVVVAGSSITEIRHVKVVKDYCTDMLQEELNRGWRILAICVQPDQRRPDYVLGSVEKIEG